MISVNEIVILVFLIVGSGIFSGSETALTAISRFKVNLFLKKNRPGSHYLHALKENPHRMLTTLLIGNNVVNIAASVLATDMALKILPGSTALAYATGIMTFFILIFGEIMPKSFANTYASRISLVVAPFIYYLGKILLPIIWIIDLITIKIFRVQLIQPKITEEEVRNIVDIAREEGGIDKEEKEMIHNIFKFDDIDVDEIKVPRVDMVIIDIKSKLKDVINLIKKEQYSRIPVVEREDKDKVVGIFYFKDALPYIQRKKFDTPIEKIMRKPFFIPKTKKIDATMKQMQKEKQQMAILVDEHGGITGLVTMEMIIEEIVGDIQDETEKEEPDIRSIGKKTWKALGKTNIEDINKAFKTRINIKEEFDTLSGYILHELGRIPKKGEEVDIGNIKFIVDRVEENRIVSVTVKKK